MVGGNANVRGPRRESCPARTRAHLAPRRPRVRPDPARGGQGVVVAERLVGAVDQVDFQSATPAPTLSGSVASRSTERDRMRREEVRSSQHPGHVLGAYRYVGCTSGPPPNGCAETGNGRPSRAHLAPASLWRGRTTRSFCRSGVPDHGARRSGNAPTPNGLKSKGCYRHRVNQGLGRRRLSVPSASARRRTGARGVTGRCHVLRAQLADVAPRHGGTARRTGRRFRSDGSYGTLETMPSSAV